MDAQLGRHHATIRRVRALRRDASLRREQGVLVAEGRHLAEEALRCGADIELALYSEPLERDDDGRRLLETFRSRGIDTKRVTAAVLDGLQDTRSPQPVLAVARWRDPGLAGGLAAAGAAPLAVVACGVQDPGNLGGLLRTADAAGADLFCAADAAADLQHPRTIRATMGSIFRLPATRAPFAAALEAFSGAGLRVLAAVPGEAPSYRDANLRGPLALVFGGEGAGLDPAVVASMDGSVTIPMHGGVESLSVGAAAAVVLFEAAHQRSNLSRSPGSG